VDRSSCWAGCGETRDWGEVCASDSEGRMSWMSSMGEICFDFILILFWYADLLFMLEVYK
jgi:hypothetical protein